MNPATKLYRFSKEGINDCLYLLTALTNDGAMRGIFSYNDHGGMNYSTYITLYIKGIITEMKEITDVPKEDHDSIPYTDTNLEMTIEDFFYEKQYQRREQQRSD